MANRIKQPMSKLVLFFIIAIFSLLAVFEFDLGRVYTFIVSADVAWFSQWNKP